MKIIDISWPISASMTEYKDRMLVKIEPFKQFERDGLRETLLSFHNHTGTHIDAPSHFLSDGASTESISLQALNGACRVLDMSHLSDCITAQDLEQCDIKAGERILFKTKNSQHAATDPFDARFVYLAKDAAQMLATIGIVCVGIDYLGIERNQPAHETHCALLSKNIAIIEGLRLAGIEMGTYQLCCLPLNIPGIDGMPARAVLIIN